MLEIQALNIQAVPVDEILMQCIVDRVQTGHTQISAELQRGLLRPVAHVGIAAQSSREQCHRGELREVGLNGGKLDAVQF